MNRSMENDSPIEKFRAKWKTPWQRIFHWQQNFPLDRNRWTETVGSKPLDRNRWIETVGTKPHRSTFEIRKFINVINRL